MVLVQLYVPAKMILDRESIVHSGVAYKFKTAPVDPNDPFRGKYISLRFEEDLVEVDTTQSWFIGEAVFALMGTDEKGFAKIESLSKETPIGDKDFLKVIIKYPPYGKKQNQARITIPFDRFYMEESKAYDAEVLSRMSFRDTSKTVYALINIKEGEGVLSNVFIDDVPIREVVRQKHIEEKKNPTHN